MIQETFFVFTNGTFVNPVISGGIDNNVTHAHGIVLVEE
jgi:hypothetical protein